MPPPTAGRVTWGKATMTTAEAMEVSGDRVDRIVCRKCGCHLDVSRAEPFSLVECPECHAQQPVPLRFGNFLLLELLGKGGMGAVYRALDQQLGRYVALKVMRKSLGADKQFVENFFREARAAAALNHRNVVQIYSCGEEKGQPYIVMELVPGGRLDAIIAEGNPMDEVRALEIGIDVAEGLKAANDVGLIHGDVKPANILFDAQGTAKVVDFGLARFVNWQQDTRGEIWGTPYYIAPEKARGQKVDHRSDIYSLGATLYHALGAKPPFDGKTATDVVLARLKNPAISLRVIRPSLQPETADVIARMLEADPFMRYPTYASLLADLREALRVAKQEARAVHKKARKPRGGPMVVTAVIVATLAVVLLGVLPLVRARREAGAPAAPAAPPAPTVVEAPAPQPAPPPEREAPAAIPPIVQPFTESGEAAIAKAFEHLLAGKGLAAEEQLQALYDKLPARGMGRYWVRLLQTVPCWEEGRGEVARMYLREILDAPFEERPDQPHPGTLLRALARYVLGEGDEGALFVEAARWPDWMQALTEFFAGVHYLRRGRYGEARSHLAIYLGKERGAPRWPYELQAMAQRWVERVDRWSELSKEAEQRIAGGQTAAAREALVAFGESAGALFRPAVEQRLAEVAKAEQAEAEARARAARIAHAAEVQKDLDRLDEVREENLPLVLQTDYRRAAAAVAKILPELTTPEGQETAQILSESYDHMDGIKKFLIKSISANPYRQPSDLGGDVVGASLTGLRLSLGGMGEMLKPWDQVSVRTLVAMTQYYLSDPTISESERAAKFLALAVLCYHNGGFKAAATYADQAVKLDANLKPRVRRLMPDILPD